MFSRRKAIGCGVVVTIGVAATVIGLTRFSAASPQSVKGNKTASEIASTFVVDPNKAAVPNSPLGTLLKDPPAAASGERHEPTAFHRPASETDTPLVETRHLATDARRVAMATIGEAYNALYIGRQSGQISCLILEDREGRGGGGCSSAADPFNGSPVWWSSLQYNDNPQVLIVFGVVDAGVRAVRLAFSRNRQAPVELSADGGFIYVVRKSTITPSDVPNAIISIGASGMIARTPLGITFGL